MDNIRIGIRGEQVVLVNDTAKLAAGFRWSIADAVATAIAYKARGVIGPEREHFGAVSVERQGEQVIVIASGKTLLIAPLAAAIAIAGAIKQQARRLEELDVFESLVMDQAILQRSGAGFGLTRNPKIQERAGQEASWNTDLRRAIPGGRLRQRQVGTPKIRLESRGDRLVAHMKGALCLTR